jgi:hypothetical protein
MISDNAQGVPLSCKRAPIRGLDGISWNWSFSGSWEVKSQDLHPVCTNLISEGGMAIPGVN